MMANNNVVAMVSTAMVDEVQVVPAIVYQTQKKHRLLSGYSKTVSATSSAVGLSSVGSRIRLV